MVEAQQMSKCPPTPRSFDGLPNRVQQRYKYHFPTINCSIMKFETRFFINVDLYFSHWDTLEAPLDCQIVSYPERRRNVSSGKKPIENYSLALTFYSTLFFLKIVKQCV